MNKKKAIIAAIGCFSTVAVATGVGFACGNPFDQLIAQGNDPIGGYHLVLNATENNPSIDAGGQLLNYVAKTKERGNDILLDFKGVVSDALSSVAILNGGGTISNSVHDELLDKNKISGIKSITVVYESADTMSLDVAWSKDSLDDKHSIEIENGVETLLKGGPAYFTLKANNTTDVKSISINYSCYAGEDYNVDIDKFEINNKDIVGVKLDSFKGSETKLVFPKYLKNSEVKNIYIENHSINPGNPGPGMGGQLSPSTFPSHIQKIYIPSSYTHVPVSAFSEFHGAVYFEGTKPVDFYLDAKENASYADFLKL